MVDVYDGIQDATSDVAPALFFPAFPFFAWACERLQAPHDGASYLLFILTSSTVNYSDWELAIRLIYN